MKCYTPAWLLIIALTAGLRLQPQVASQPGAPPTLPVMVTTSSVCGGSLTYDQLTADERKAPVPQVIQLGKSPVELTIIATEFSDKLVDAKRAPDLCWSSVLTVGVNVSTTGEVYSFANGRGALRGGGGDKLAPEVFARLKEAMDNLPDDHHRVPPATRRIFVETVRNGRITVRLYDSADLPERITEMVRLTSARINIAKPLFKPDRVLPPEEAATLNLPTPAARYDDVKVSPDGSLGVLHDFATKTLTVYQGSRWRQNNVPEGGKIVRVLPEVWLPPEGCYSANSEFSPDGRYLLVTWGNRIGALLFDTESWQPVTDPKVFPQNLKEYLHAPDWNWGIAVTNAGETLVWDQQSHRVVSRLPGLGEFEPPPLQTDKQGHSICTAEMGEVRSAAFSPDLARVAIVSGPDDIFKLRLSIFDLQSGKKEHDLWPVVWISYPNGEPVWWNDGRWLIAPFSSQFSGSGTGVWEAETGHFVGTLDQSGCDERGNTVAAGTRLIRPCSTPGSPDVREFEWTVDGVSKQIEAVEDLVSRGQDFPR